MTWREIGDNIFVRRHESYDLNIGLIVGTDACLVIDTRESLAHRPRPRRRDKNGDSRRPGRS